MMADPPTQIKHHQLKDLIGYQDLTFEFGESIDIQTILLSKTNYILIRNVKCLLDKRS